MGMCFMRTSQRASVIRSMQICGADAEDAEDDVQVEVVARVVWFDELALALVVVVVVEAISWAWATALESLKRARGVLCACGAGLAGVEERNQYTRC